MDTRLEGYRARRFVRWMTYVAVLTGLAGCSLISLKSPEKPLSTRDLNARILTREYSAHFISAVGQSADQIAAASDDAAVRQNALRWKIAATAGSERAASQIAPMMGLLDTWALAEQMSRFLSSGAGHSLFGAQQPFAVILSADLAREAADLARRLTAVDEYDKDRRFIDDYATAHPIDNLHFARPSIVELWVHDSGAQHKLVDSLGTVPEALADAGDRLRMLGENAPAQVLWQAQLAAQESGIRTEDLRAALRRLDERMTQLAGMIDATPKLVGGMVRDAGTRFDTSWSEVMRDVRAQENDLSTSVTTQRDATLSALDLERAAMTADATRIADQVVRDTGYQIRQLVREALALLIVLLLVALGAPFAAGYVVGRARRRT